MESQVLHIIISHTASPGVLFFLELVLIVQESTEKTLTLSEKYHIQC
jgi:hypothetical protein